MRKKDIRVATIIAGFLVMVSIVCSNVLMISSRTKDVSAKTEKTTDDSTVQFVSTPAGTVPTTFSVELNNEVYCLFEVCSGFSKPEASEPEAKTQPLRYLLTLFRVIISPNAP